LGGRAALRIPGLTSNKKFCHETPPIRQLEPKKESLSLYIVKNWPQELFKRRSISYRFAMDDSSGDNALGAFAGES
ncbi:MAG: hypothetical protein AABZ09_11630, partial [Candidatus Binatota bacterium]